MLGRRLSVLIALSAIVGVPTTAHGERIAGVVDGNGLIIVDSVVPGVGTVRTIGPLATNGERVVGIDVRPATQQLVGVSIDALNATRTYVIDPDTGAATLVGSFGAPALLGTVPIGIDFNPVVDRLRLSSSTGAHLRVNPVTGAVAGIDTNLTFLPAAIGPVVAVAYDRSSAGATQTTLYAIDRGSSALALIGGVNGIPSPNTGQVSQVGPLGLSLDSTGDAGFDIAPGGTAYASLTVGGVHRLYTINLTTGAATLVGALPATFRELTVLPPVTPVPPVVPPPDTTKPAVLIAPAATVKLAALRRRGILVPFSCSEACTITARLVGRSKNLGTATAGLSGAGVGKVRVRLSAAGRKTLVKTKRLPVQVVVVAKDPAGNTRSVKARVLLVV